MIRVFHDESQNSEFHDKISEIYFRATDPNTKALEKAKHYVADVEFLILYINLLNDKVLENLRAADLLAEASQIKSKTTATIVLLEQALVNLGYNPPSAPG